MKKLIYCVLLSLLATAVYAAPCSCPTGFYPVSTEFCLARAVIERPATCLSGKLVLDKNPNNEDVCTGSLQTTIPTGVPSNEIRELRSAGWFLVQRAGGDLWRKREIKPLTCAIGK
ncbi:hypothetical protein [Thiolinea disciformis]|uniref:hypothetical protein n=1 Tax=Thiolinea disciformis TaxID=125614 RepID=UPI000373E68C|nr:hypothetical protein [Thiolinea disciformis]